METGTANDHGRTALRLQRLEDGSAGGLELGHGERSLRIDEVDQMVANPFTHLPTGLRRPNVHAPIHLHRIDREDLGIETLRQGHGQVGLPGGRWSEYGEDPQIVLPTRW